MTEYPRQIKKKTYFCPKCRLTLNADQFYLTNNPKQYGPNDGRTQLCRKCLTLHIDNWDPSTFAYRDPMKPDEPCVLEILDVPWAPDEWNVLLQRHGNTKTALSTTGIMGKYLSKMKLNQFRKLRYSDTDNLRKIKEQEIRESMSHAGFSETEILEAISKGFVPPPERPSMETVLNAIDENYGGPSLQSQQIQPEEPEVDYGLTDEDKIYLRTKWGRDYSQDEWIQLERKYNDFMNSYDIQTAGHKDNLVMLCKTSLKANQLLDINDMDGYQKAQKAYVDLMRSGKFTAAQNKEENGEFVDSVGELVSICEADGFIERFYIDSPKDKADKVLQDLQSYTRSLIMEETNLGNMIETALRQIQIDADKAAEIHLEDFEDEDDLLLAQVESAYNTVADDELTDDDWEEYNAFLNEEEE